MSILCKREVAWNLILGGYVVGCVCHKSDIILYNWKEKCDVLKKNEVQTSAHIHDNCLGGSISCTHKIDTLWINNLGQFIEKSKSIKYTWVSIFIREDRAFFHSVSQ